MYTHAERSHTHTEGHVVRVRVDGLGKHYKTNTTCTENVRSAVSLIERGEQCYCRRHCYDLFSSLMITMFYRVRKFVITDGKITTFPRGQHDVKATSNNNDDETTATTTDDNKNSNIIANDCVLASVHLSVF